MNELRECRVRRREGKGVSLKEFYRWITSQETKGAEVQKTWTMMQQEMSGLEKFPEVGLTNIASLSILKLMELFTQSSLLVCCQPNIENIK